MPGFFLSIQCLCSSATAVTQLSGSEFLYCKVVSHGTNTPTHLPLQPWMDTGFRGGPSGKEPSCQCKRRKRRRFHLWIRKTPWRRPCNPRQCSCLENPMDRGAWGATVHGVVRVGQNLTTKPPPPWMNLEDIKLNKPVMAYR